MANDRALEIDKTDEKLALHSPDSAWRSAFVSALCHPSVSRSDPRSSHGSTRPSSGRRFLHAKETCRLLWLALPAALAITGDMSPLREGIFGHSMDEYSHVSFVDLSGILKDDTAPRRKLTAMHCQESAKQASRLFCRSPGHGHWPSRALVRNSSVAFRNQSVLSGLALEEFPCRFRLLEDSRTAGCPPG